MNALPRIKETSNLRLVPTSKETRKVSVDDGYTKIPNDLLFAIGKFGFTQRQFNLLIAVIQKTLSWHKEMDWICNSQICELVDLPNEQKASKTKQELVRMNVLIQKGNQIGINLVVSEWEKVGCTKDANIAQNVQQRLHKTGNSDCTKRANTKETITKETITKEITPLPPQGGNGVGEVDEKISADAQSALAYYNELADGSCRDTKPFITLLTKTSSREAYSLEEIKLVVKWVLTTWKRRNGSPPKPKNICTITRFDGYLSDAIRWQKNKSLYQGVVDAYNEILGDRLVPLETLDALAENQIQALLPSLKNQSVDGFVAYFNVFAENAKPFYFEPERKIGFSFLMKPETLAKTRRGEL